MEDPMMRIAVVVLTCLLAAAPALAHEGGNDIRGEVVSADAAQVTIRSTDGHAQRFALTPQTQIIIGNSAGKPADLKPGLRAVVHEQKVDGSLVATSIKLGTGKNPSTSK
jgi:hypothetical protein